jgi:predicted DNA-binding transcriptional regulator AlpA
MTILLKADILDLLKISEATLFRWLNESRCGTGTFPLPISPPKKTLRWNAEDINEWCAPNAVNCHVKSRPHKVDRVIEEQRQVRLQKALERHGLHK